MTLKFALIAVAAAVSIASPALAGAPSAKDFARLPALTSLSISPDGQRIAGISSPDGEHTIIKVWKTDALDQPPVSIGVGERFHVKHLHATALSCLGLDPNHLSYFYAGRDQKLVGVEGAQPIRQSPPKRVRR